MDNKRKVNNKSINNKGVDNLSDIEFLNNSMVLRMSKQRLRDLYNGGIKSNGTKIKGFTFWLWSI